MVWLKVPFSWLCSNADQFWLLASDVCLLGFKYHCTKQNNALTLDYIGSLWVPYSSPYNKTAPFFYVVVGQSHALKVELSCEHYFPLDVFNQKYATNLSHLSSKCKETGFIVLTLYAFNPGIVAMRTDR